MKYIIILIASLLINNESLAEINTFPARIHCLEFDKDRVCLKPQVSGEDFEQFSKCYNNINYYYESNKEICNKNIELINKYYFVCAKIIGTNIYCLK
jgi:hypothetical protein